MEIIGKIQKSWAGGYFATLAIKKEYGPDTKCYAWGDDYTVNRGISSNYEIHVLKGNDEMCCIEVDDYTCETWKDYKMKV